MPSRGQYTALPPPDPSRELEDAFGSDNEDDEDYDTPLTRTRGNTYSADGHPAEAAPLMGHANTSSNTTTAAPGAYDFERDYDHPPPGSPPQASSQALPNDYGNSNGFVPTEPPSRPAPSHGKPSIFRRAFGAFMPAQYAPLPTHEGDVETGSGSGREGAGGGRRVVRGGGVENDGVFANVMAKPVAGRTVRMADGTEVYMAPEESTGKEGLPSYQEAQQDTVPTYRETVLLSPSSGSLFPGAHSGPNGSFDASGSMIIDSMATGSFWLFLATTFISFFFQFIGFMFTYLLHTTHAAKYGSRAGLGLTLIQLGFYSRNWTWRDLGDSVVDEAPSEDGTAIPEDSTVTVHTGAGSGSGGIMDSNAPLSAFTSKDWIAFLLMTLGWFLLLTSLLSFWRVKRWESSLTSASTANPAPSREEIERDIAIRRTVASVFGIGGEEVEDHYSGHGQTQRGQGQGEAQDGGGQGQEDARIAAQITEVRARVADERLTRDLRAAGLL